MVDTQNYEQTIGAILSAYKARKIPRDGQESLSAMGIEEFECVTQFDQAYGGIQMITEMWSGGPLRDDWTVDDGQTMLFGAAWCVESGAHEPILPADHPFFSFFGDTFGFTPVAYAPYDVIYFLDRVGRGYIYDSGSDIWGPHLMADNPQQFFSRLILTQWCLHPTRQVAEGSHGQSLASQLNLLPVESANGVHERWWGDGVTIVGERITFPGEGHPLRRVTWGRTDSARNEELASAFSAVQV